MKNLTLYLCRHGDTAWSGERRLAGRTDLLLTKQGEETARSLGDRIRGLAFERVLVSPLLRARHTAELAGFGEAVVDERLREMSFGKYEGRTVDEVRAEVPGWAYLRDGCPDGDRPADLADRADALLSELSIVKGNVALFSHSVMLRVIAARYLDLAHQAGRLLMMAPGALSIVTYDHVEDSPAIASWNSLETAPRD